MNGLKQYFLDIKKSFKLKKNITLFAFILVAIVFIILNKTGAIKRSNINLITTASYSIVLALSLSLIVGFLGELSLGHAAFMGIGAYMGAYFQKVIIAQLTVNNPTLSIILAMLVGGFIAAIFGLVVGLPALRLKGDYLAIVTLAFGEIVKTIFQNSKAETFGGAMGFTTYGRFDINNLMIINLIVAILVLIIVQNIIRSKQGRAIMAIRDNEIAAKAMGVNVTFYKLIVFVIAAFIAGVAGVLFANSQATFLSSKFDYNYSIDILVMVVLGGMGNVTGTILSATLITFINTKLAVALSGDLAAYKNLVYALVLIIVVVYNNAPKLKFIREKYNLRNLFEFIKTKIFKKKNDPANEKEFNAEWSKIPTKIEMDAILSTDFKPDNTYTPDKPDAPKGDRK